VFRSVEEMDTECSEAWKRWTQSVQKRGRDGHRVIRSVEEKSRWVQEEEKGQWVQREEVVDKLARARGRKKTDGTDTKRML